MHRNIRPNERGTNTAIPLPLFSSNVKGTVQCAPLSRSLGHRPRWQLSAPISLDDARPSSPALGGRKGMCPYPWPRHSFVKTSTLCSSSWLNLMHFRPVVTSLYKREGIIIYSKGQGPIHSLFAIALPFPYSLNEIWQGTASLLLAQGIVYAFFPSPLAGRRDGSFTQW